MRDKIQIRSLKIFVKRQGHGYPLLQQIISQEKDQLKVHDFVIKCEIWLRILREEEALRNSGVGLLQDRFFVRK